MPEGYVARIETKFDISPPASIRPGHQRDIFGPRPWADSLDIVEFLLEVEEEFGITIPDDEAERIQTVGQAIKSIEQHTNIERRDRWIEIVSLPEMVPVTVVRFLAPGNKAGLGRIEYLEQRAVLIDGLPNFVEIDLLLRGRRMPMAKPLPPGEYYARVGRTRTPDAEVYAWTIRHVLPAIPIPLRSPDTDVMLDLAQAFDLTYDRGRYSRLLRYHSALPDILPLSPADREWAESDRPLNPRTSPPRTLSPSGAPSNCSTAISRARRSAGRACPRGTGRRPRAAGARARCARP